MNSDQGILDTRRDRATVVTLSALFLLFVSVALIWGGEAFRPYFFGLPPLVGALVTVALGGLALRYLSQHSPLRLSGSTSPQNGWALAAVLATGLAAVIVAADFVLALPADLNVAWPQSLVFYPAMAFVAEVAFHLVPLALLYAIARTSQRKRHSHDPVPFAFLAIAALIEPIFQVLPVFAGTQPTTTTVAVFFQVLAFNATALWLFVRFGFITTYVFRVIYYLHWHIAWGHFRVDVLF